ncbi:Pimeloyl-ACP methyl ester carboxylesterase [Algoriphagus locisalis]|uniref:Pimeloyl-ACP methyl ester carboxylesterase n=1 Tax=Algoriphagus locisalis TaxID=305507 RepID=A0A1I7E8E5_9BACT|nr:alpha/beta hydrolase [Algoriphagus locisalis]SFU20172.1 Pimeloyl-ACP methyl ester carboxylesterase [Algoriphagus locisalis]
MKKYFSCLIVAILLVTISEAQTSFRVQRAGTGKPILFLPGFGSSGQVWDQISSKLPDHESITLTYAGFDGVTPISFPWYSQITVELINFVEENNLQELTVVGHSMGGNLAVELVKAIPTRVAQLVLVDALPCMREVMMPGIPAEGLSYDGDYNKQLMNMNAADFEVYASQMAQGMATAVDDQQQLKDWILAADRETFVKGYTDLLKLDLRTGLENIKTPVLILVADQPYGAQALETMKTQYSALQNKEFKMAQNSRHFIMMDQPEWLVQELQQLIKQ